MNCTMALRMLDAYIDHELDTATSAEMAQHVVACAECSALRSQRLAVQSALRATLVREPAPASLRAAVLRDIRRADARRPPRAEGSWARAWQMLLLGASTAVAGAVGGWWFAQPQGLDGIPEYVVTRHVASLSPEGPRIDVASSDRHSVKPWFQGRVDFAPVVRDLSAQGFELVGGRLDRIGDRPAAAVVYRLRGHAINVFSWRVKGHAVEAERSFTLRGFNVETWNEADMDFAAVSDAESAELKRFAAAYRAP
jgi:anti-sigma factor (TIGR02949 family)